MSLKKIRTERQLSRQQLAKISGVNVRTIDSYEDGTRDINGAKLMTLFRLSDALDCRISDILTDKELIARLRECDEF